MKFLVALSFAAISAVSLYAQTTPPEFPFTYYIHDTTGVNADTPLPSIYQFAATSVGSNSHIVIKAVNTSSYLAFLGTVFVSNDSTASTANNNFSVTGLNISAPIAVGGSFVFTLNFSPAESGPITGYLQTSYQVQTVNTCSFTSNTPATQCPSGLNLTATLTGTATQPQLVLTYQGANGSTLLQPGGVSSVNFGNVSTSGNSTINFTLSNESSVAMIVPAISITPPNVYNPNSPFSVNTANIPSTLAPGAAVTFPVTFAPSSTLNFITTLVIGTNTYLIQGQGIIVADIDALEITYVDSTGVVGLPQSATPISFGQSVSSVTGPTTLTFTVQNSSISFNAVSISAITVSGTGFALGTITGTSASFPISLGPGSSLSFPVTFTPAGSGTYTGSLNIGGRIFSLSASSVAAPLPAVSIAVTPTTLSSQQQATVAVNLASASPLSETGTLTLSFTPSVVGVKDDPAVLFTSTNSRTLTLSVASGATSASYNKQTQFTFQTGTTAGTLTFTANFTDAPEVKQSFTITPSLINITSASAVRSDPNLVVTIAGYDNTYSAGKLNFTFYNTTGQQISPVAVDATSNFQQLFFTDNTDGGAFTLTATFPVTGDVTKVGSVLIGINNSIGSTSSSQNFQ